MTKTRFPQWVVLACIGTVAACTSGDGGTAGNTELNVVVPTNAGTPSEIDIQTVEYTIACAGNDDTFLDNNASFTDQVRIDGNLEVVDGRTSFSAGKACNGGDNNGQTCAAGAPGQAFCAPGGGTCDLVADNGPNLRNQSEVWQGFMDLPPGPCTVQLRARDNDGEVICTATEPFNIAADVTTKVNVLLICDTSFQAPVGSLDVDGTFSFNVGNFCPDLFVFNASDTEPVENFPSQAFPGLIFAATPVEARFRDGDSTCGDNCDPQSCTVSAQGILCVPGPDPGVSTTITCSSPAGPTAQPILDCEPNEIPDAECVISGDTTGIPAEGLDGAFACQTSVQCDPSGLLGATCEPNRCNLAVGGPLGTLCTDNVTQCTTDADCETVTCDIIANLCPDGTTACSTDADCTPRFCDFSNSNPLLNKSAVVICRPPALGGLPGDTITCTAVTTDGDNDCDKTKTLTIKCPGLAPCDPLATPAPPDCTAGLTSCQVGVCNDSSGTAVCDITNLPPGTTCDPPNGQCGGTGGVGDGVCTQTGCNNDPTNCDDGNPCTEDLCPQPSDLCTNNGDPTQDGATACNAGGGPGTGTCDSTFADCNPPAGADTCVTDEQRFCPANDECDVPGECPAPGTCDVTCDGTTCPDGVTDCTTNGDQDCIDAVAGQCADGATACDADADCPLDTQCASATCDTTSIPNACGLDTTSTALCDAGGGADTGQCSAGVCGALPPPPASALVQLSCGLPATVSLNLVPFPAPIDVTPTSTLTGGNAFTYDVTPGVALDQAFLEGAAVTVFTSFGLTLTLASVNVAQVEVSNVAGCTTANPVIVPDDGLPFTCVSDLIPAEDGFACPGPDGTACGVLGVCTENAGLPYKVIIPTTALPCGGNTCNLGTSLCADGTTACTTDAECNDAVCQAVEGAAPGALCCAGPQDGCPPEGSTIDTDVCQSFGQTVGLGIPTQVSDSIVLDTFPQVSNSCPVAAAAGQTLAICASGNRFNPVLPSQPPSETYFQVQVGALPVVFDCEIGVPNNPIECASNADCVAAAPLVCDDATDEPFTRAVCTVANEATDCPSGACVPNTCDVGETPPTCVGPKANTTPIDVTGDVCAAADANAGATCTDNADCDATCDTDTDQCSDGSACTAPNADDQCLGTGGGTCVPACVTYPIL